MQTALDGDPATLPATEHYTEANIRLALATVSFGHPAVFLPVIGSTNDEARRLARAGAAEGTVVVADYQTRGRGRLDRQWEAPVGSSLLVSLIFRPQLSPWQVQRVTMVCGLAAVDALQQVGLHADLKWPNDIVHGDAKLGGILTELGTSGDQVDWVVVGIGLNVNVDAAQLPTGLLAPATSVSQVLGRCVPRLPLLRALLEFTERRYAGLCTGHSPHDAWAARLVTLGREVAVTDSDGTLEGLAVGVDENGGLQVRVADGSLRTVMAGDATLRLGSDWRAQGSSAIMRYVAKASNWQERPAAPESPRGA